MTMYEQCLQMWHSYEHVMLFCMMFVDVAHITLATTTVFFFLLWRRACWRAYTERRVNEARTQFDGQRVLDSINHMHVNSLDQISQIVQAFTANKDE